MMKDDVLMAVKYSKSFSYLAKIAQRISGTVCRSAPILATHFSITRTGNRYRLELHAVKDDGVRSLVDSLGIVRYQLYRTEDWGSLSPNDFS